ncbi:N-acetyl-gamma-glutamyl-phosphate reductase [Conexibacter sp. DBS9H8]|uniref:N-acetyl-gamma-glutamyl-phosphate reductase n=1 Tax=Conexibacter sp. DBS9H8 TaxID=2937801 RepID=UPI00200EDFCB|nr:N-acetyl-gamma-glutamyl-phosphate reductase [Conexibacter sp. DBS9H8]
MPESGPRVAVLGASGYAGALAAALLTRHPAFQLGAASARSDAGRRLDHLYPHHRVAIELVSPDTLDPGGFDAAIVAYPHMAAAPVVAAWRSAGVKVVDLSADFRLRDVGTYGEWYGAHPEAELIAEAVYGLPELYRTAIREASLVANPGCYPTATILALAPLARAGLIGDLVIDAKSGVSGAGRAATEATHFVSVDENVRAYKVPRHRHTPEIEQELAALGNPVTITFTPHLLPLDQGELVSCYVTLTEPDRSETELRDLYADAYREEAFIETVDTLPGVRDVRDTNICRIGLHKDERTGRAIVFGAIDNLWKGTASQAIQNLNLMFGYAEGLGIG